MKLKIFDYVWLTYEIENLNLETEIVGTYEIVGK